MMQLDLLQEGLSPVTKDIQPPSPLKNKSTKRSIATAPELVELPLKPLPESLQPSFISKPDIVKDTPVAAAPVIEVAVTTEAGGGSTLPAKNPEAFKTISEAAKFLGVPQHVLRFWESRFAQIKPLKLAGGRRYYRPDDMEILSTIKHLLYKQGYTIKGAKKVFGSRKKIDLSQPVNILSQEIQPFPEVKQRVLTKKQQSQLSGIRQELIGLRETLAPLLA